MATRTILTRSAHPLLKRTPFQRRLVKTTPFCAQSLPCPLWSSSFPLCLPKSAIAPISSISSSSSSLRSLSAESMASTANPLLEDFDFPPFDAVHASHVRPGIRALLQSLEEDLEELERSVEPSWGKLVEPLEKIVDRLSVVWGIVNHLKSVKDSSELRSAIEEVQPEKVKFSLRLGQSKPIYEAFKAIRESPDWNSLSEARKRIVESQIKEAVLLGVSLEDEKRDKFNEIQQELERLSQKFEENVLDATKKFAKLITDKKEIEGLPATALGMAAQTAVSKGHENATAENGPWIITLDGPSFMSVMQHAKNRELREEIYRAYVTRASSGDLDNTVIIDEILKLRLEKAKLLNYNNYAEVSMATKMATVEKAEELLEKLRSASWNAAVQDNEDLKEFSKKQGALEADNLNHWDSSFWSERLRESKYDINEEELRPYFSLPKVMDGLFSLAKTLFGIEVEAADGLAPVWNSDVRFYCVKDSSGSPVSYFYFDPYTRSEEKRGGAWMDEVVSRSRVLSRNGTSARLPVAHMVCNQTPPVGNKPSLMTFREVETVFHEFGHALQHMLTKQDEGLVAGIRGIEWDAVELPSQFMENWCYHRADLGMAATQLDFLVEMRVLMAESAAEWKASAARAEATATGFLSKLEGFIALQTAQNIELKGAVTEIQRSQREESVKATAPVKPAVVPEVRENVQPILVVIGVPKLEEPKQIQRSRGTPITTRVRLEQIRRGRQPSAKSRPIKRQRRGWRARRYWIRSGTRTRSGRAAHQRNRAKRQGRRRKRKRSDFKKGKISEQIGRGRRRSKNGAKGHQDLGETLDRADLWSRGGGQISGSGGGPGTDLGSVVSQGGAITTRDCAGEVENMGCLARFHADLREFRESASRHGNSSSEEGSGEIAGDLYGAGGGGVAARGGQGCLEKEMGCLAPKSQIYDLRGSPANGGRDGGDTGEVTGDGGGGGGDGGSGGGGSERKVTRENLAIGIFGQKYQKLNTRYLEAKVPNRRDLSPGRRSYGSRDSSGSSGGSIRSRQRAEERFRKARADSRNRFDSWSRSPSPGDRNQRGAAKCFPKADSRKTYDSHDCWTRGTSTGGTTFERAFERKRAGQR